MNGFSYGVVIFQLLIIMNVFINLASSSTRAEGKDSSMTTIYIVVFIYISHIHISYISHISTPHNPYLFPLLSIDAANRLIRGYGSQDNLNTSFNASGLINTTEPEGIASISGRTGLEVVTVEFEVVVVYGEAIALSVLGVGVFTRGVACNSLAWSWERMKLARRE